jgi:hypothetical protein
MYSWLPWGLSEWDIFPSSVQLANLISWDSIDASSRTASGNALHLRNGDSI